MASTLQALARKAGRAFYDFPYRARPAPAEVAVASTGNDSRDRPCAPAVGEEIV